MTEFAYSSGCRQQWILNYFGRKMECRAAAATSAWPWALRKANPWERKRLGGAQALSGIARIRAFG
ncbi:MAG: hypothetical protein ACLT38_10530 [Akkermansia sp.]